MDTTQEFIQGLGGYLAELFPIGVVCNMRFVHGGLLCQNFLVEAEQGTFFLKQYRKQTSAWVYEIKFAEEFFADNDIQVILPFKDESGRAAFWYDDNWYSLFPFVEGIQKASDALSPHHIESMARLLAKMHHAGMHFSGREMPLLKLWDRGRFLLDYVEIMRRLNAVPDADDMDRLFRSTLERKYQFVMRNNMRPDDFDLPRNCLLHGDFQHGNVFFDQTGTVTAVFDFEKTCLGPRAFELVRALMITNFDHGFDADDFDRARLFLRVYQEHFPISFEEFFKGMHVYSIDLAHVLWMEAKRYLKGLKQYDDIYRSHAMRTAHLGQDIRAFCQRLYE